MCNYLKKQQLISSRLGFLNVDTFYIKLNLAILVLNFVQFSYFFKGNKKRIESDMNSFNLNEENSTISNRQEILSPIIEEQKH